MKEEKTNFLTFNGLPCTNHVCIKVKEIKKGQVTSGSSLLQQFKREWIPRIKSILRAPETDENQDIIYVIVTEYVWRFCILKMDIIFCLS